MRPDDAAEIIEVRLQGAPGARHVALVALAEALHVEPIRGPRGTVLALRGPRPKVDLLVEAAAAWSAWLTATLVLRGGDRAAEVREVAQRLGLQVIAHPEDPTIVLQLRGPRAAIAAAYHVLRLARERALREREKH